MPCVANLQPADLSFKVEDDETVMDAAERQGVVWPSVCGGACECGVCFVEVLNPEAVDDPSPAETTVIRRMAQRAKRGGVIRLACCLKPTVDVELFRVGPRRYRQTGVQAENEGQTT